MVQDLSIVRGDSETIDGQIQRQNAPFDIAGAKLWFTVKSQYDANDDPANILFQKTSDPGEGIVIEDAGNGDITIQIDPSDTSGVEIPSTVKEQYASDYIAEYYYDIQVKTADDGIYTAARGRFLVSFDVTVGTT